MLDNAPVTDAYAAAGVDTDEAGRGVAALVEVLQGIDPGRSPLAIPLPGHYASVLRIAPGLGIALATDSVGSKVILAEQLGRFETIGIDCVAMNVNDLICVGAEPLALLDYVAVERAEAEMLRQLAVGLRTGAEAAGVEIPGGEVCQLPEVIRGHPSPGASTWSARRSGASSSTGSSMAAPAGPATRCSGYRPPECIPTG